MLELARPGESLLRLGLTETVENWGGNAPAEPGFGGKIIFWRGAYFFTEYVIWRRVKYPVFNPIN